MEISNTKKPAYICRLFCMDYVDTDPTCLVIEK